MFRVGNGYDVHQLKEGLSLILGGVKIPFDKGLLGHSDADVLTHAIMDALLGALALGSIGDHFPDSDPKYAGISSMLLLAQVVALVAEKGYTIGNVDTVLVAQAPKLKPYIGDMRDSLAKGLGIRSDRVSVKATTTEFLGFEGEQKGMSCHAIVGLNKAS